jgi:hypothetical protein
MLKLLQQLFWGVPALAGGAKTRRAAPLQRARAEPLEKGRVGGHEDARPRGGHKAREVRYRMAETLRGSGRLSRLATGPRLDRGDTPISFADRVKSRVNRIPLRPAPR